MPLPVYTIRAPRAQIAMLGIMAVGLLMTIGGAVSGRIAGGAVVYLPFMGLLSLVTCMLIRTWWFGETRAWRIEFAPEGFRIPDPLMLRGPRFAAFRNVSSVHIWKLIANESVALRAGNVSFVLPVSRFRNERDARDFVDAVRAGVSRGPGGAERLAKIDACDLAGRVVTAARPLAAYAAIALILVVFAAQWLSASSEGSVLGVALGANVPELTLGAEWWRGVTANLMHVGSLHAGINLIGLWFAGLILEGLLGWRKWCVVAAVSGVAGAGASAVVHYGEPAVSQGASTLFYGLMAALFVLQIKYREQLPAMLQPKWALMLPTLGLLAVLEMTSPMVDVSGHAGAALGGFTAAWGVTREPRLLDLAKRNGPAIRIAALCSIAVFALGGIYLVSRAWQLASEGSIATHERLIESNHAPEWLRAATAWSLATMDSPPPAALARTVATLEGFARPESRPDSRSTLAAIYYRQGAIDRAIELERDVVQNDIDREHRSLLARFELARTSESGAVVDGDCPPLIATAQLADSVLRVDVDTPCSAPVRIHAALLQATTLIGHATLILEPDQIETQLGADQIHLDLSGPDVVVVVTSLDSRVSTGSPLGDPIGAYRLDKEVRKLP